MKLIFNTLDKIDLGYARYIVFYIECTIYLISNTLDQIDFGYSKYINTLYILYRIHWMKFISNTSNKVILEILDTLLLLQNTLDI